MRGTQSPTPQTHPWTVLIDGRSGAGKTTYARELAGNPPAWLTDNGLPVKLVHLDDIYPGWDGLARASDIVAQSVLATDQPGFHRWDWVNYQRGEWVPLDPQANLIVEGVGSLTSNTKKAAHQRSGRRVRTVEVYLPDAERKRRALARDPGFAEYWEMWAEQEKIHRRTMPAAEQIIHNE